MEALSLTDFIAVKAGLSSSRGSVISAGAS